jgi:hypothetical protein
MNHIDTLKLALEAFEWNYNTDLDNIPACEQWAKMLKQNITALRQAIEQAEKQEPVAYIHRNEYNEYRLEPHDNFDIKNIPFNVDVLLYTSPLQRQPLTDEEIMEIHDPFMGKIEFARAIEAAHGIKGEA